MYFGSYTIYLHFCTLLFAIMQKVFLFSVLIFSLFSCKEARYTPQIPKDAAPLLFSYPYKDILPYGNANPELRIEKINTTYPELSRGIFEEILGIGHPDSIFTRFGYAGFLADPYILETKHKMDSVFTDFSSYEKEYNKAFQNYAWYTPEAIVPSVAFSYNNFQYAVVALDTCMLVGLEMYLGKDFKGYDGLQWPDYIKVRRDADLMVAESITGWLMTEFPKKNDAITFIDEIIYRGKIIFYLHKLLPDYATHRLLGYSPDQFDFCEKNEGNIYGFFIEKKLLYSEDSKEIKKYTEEAPFATGMPRETPGRIAWYLGYKIMESYMENHPEISIDQLMKNHDYKAIFAQSKYKPRK